MNIYSQIIGQCDKSIQVGDFGVGFVTIPNFTPNHRFIRGNHDHPELCKSISNWIPDGTIENNMMFVGGAWSIDQHYRIEGKSWWPEEELSISELNHLIEKYEDAKPMVMVTHDCPEIVSGKLVSTLYPTRTGQALSAMFAIHKPKLWIFGHYHVSARMKIDETVFACLNINEWIDVEL